MRDLRRDGLDARPLVRVPSAGAPSWDPGVGEIDADGLEGFDAVVHLAGENIAGGRWTASRRRRIQESRVGATGLLAAALAKLDSPPKCLISASALGFYGDRGEELLDETSPRGSGFLAELASDWEAAAAPTAKADIRVVNLRIGTVLGEGGGILPRLTPLFLAGLGGRLGSGRQFMSWIALDDLVQAIRFAIETNSLEGPVNACAPAPVTNGEFTRLFARSLGRRAILPVPAFAIRLAFGQMADELLLSGQRVRPARLLEAGFDFRHANLGGLLRHLYSKSEGPLHGR